MITNGVQHALDLAVRLLVPPGSAGAHRVADLPERAGHLRRPARPDQHLRRSTRRRLGRRPAARPRSAGRRPDRVPDPGVPQPDRSPDARRAARAAAGRGARGRHRPGRSTSRLWTSTWATLAMPPPVARCDRHCPGADHRRHEQAVLGWPADRLDPGRRAGGAAPGRGPGRRRHGRAGARPAGRGVAAAPAPIRSWRARRVQLREQRDALVAAVRAKLPNWHFTVPEGGVTLWAELDAPVSSASRTGGRVVRRTAGSRAAVRRRRHAGAVPAAAVHAAGAGTRRGRRPDRRGHPRDGPGHSADLGHPRPRRLIRFGIASTFPGGVAQSLECSRTRRLGALPGTPIRSQISAADGPVRSD